MQTGNWYNLLRRIVIICIILGLILSGLFNLNLIFIGHTAGGSGSPPINGTTTKTWFADSYILRDDETINTVDIQINSTGSMEWNNISADITGDVLVEQGGYFNLTNCVLKLTGNLTVNGTVNFKGVTLKINSAFEGEYHIEVWGSMYITDLDNDNGTTSDASVITAFDTNYNYQFWVRWTANFTMSYSILRECGYYAPPYRTQQYGLFIQASDTIIANNTFENNYVGVILYYASNNLLVNNTIESNTDGVRLVAESRSTVTNNVVSNNNDDGIELIWGATNNTISFNTISNNGDDGVDIDAGGDNNIVINNTFTSNKYGTMITDADGNLIANNTYSSNTNTGVGLYSTSTNNRIINNYASGSSAGFSAVTADGNYFERNTAKSNTIGFMFQGSANNKLLHNKIISNSWWGISLEQTSSGNNVHYNNITGNGWRGIRVVDSASQVNATLNWWGDSTGPYHSSTNTGGKGDQVTDYVKYNPWLKKSLEDIDPSIGTTDDTTSVEDQYYEITYTTVDANVGDTIYWRQEDNASWLHWGEGNQTLYGTPTNADVGIYWVMVNVTYGYGGTDEHNFTLTVSNIAPIITSSDVTSVFEDASYSNDYNSDDDGQGIITWKLNTNATWLSIDSLTGVVSGTPVNDDVGTCWVNVTVNDGNGGVNSSNFTLTVYNTNDAPGIQTADITTAAEDSYYEVIYTAVDVDKGDTITWLFDTSSNWLSWGSINHTIFGTPKNADVGSCWVLINISDGNGGYDEHNFTITVTNTNDVPVINNEDLLTAVEDKHYVQAYSAVDEDVGDILTWSLETNASWLSWSNGNNSLFGLPTNDYVGTYWVWVNVTDSKGESDEHYFILTVQNTNDKPEIETSDVLIVLEDDYYEVIYSAVDVDAGDLLTWTKETNATWLSWGESNHTLYGTPRNSDVGSYSVEIKATDSEGEFDEHQFILTVQNTNDAPVIITTDIISAAEDEQYSITYSATDVDIGDTLKWSFQTDASWLFWGSSNQTLYGLPGNNDVGSFNVKIKVSDSFNEYDEHDFILTVSNVNDPPEIIGAPAELIVNPNVNYEIDYSSYISDVDNELSELSLIENSEYAEVFGFKIIYHYKESIVKETVEIKIFDGKDYSIPHYVSVTVTTKEILQPEIIDVFPEGTGVSVKTEIKAVFNKDMNFESIKNAFSIVPVTNGYFAMEDLTLIFTPDSELLYNTTYKVTIDRSAVGNEGFDLKTGSTWEFTTEIEKIDDGNGSDKKEEDTDSDGYPDDNDTFPNDPLEWVDTDLDKIGDNADPDDDNDWLSDEEENAIGTDPLLKDTDSDGRIDSLDEYPLDPSKWESETKEPEEEPSSSGLIAGIIIIIIIFVLLLLILFRIKTKRQPEEAPAVEIKGPEPEPELEEKGDGEKEKTPPSL